ncbi:MAG: tRNA preQ1(34) S-adenosylmethionine ribosyltransferase-isomerase QueA [candidate division WOR-3 bacterium]|nr:tRNA preQ1(34) S-adenosylmethionine ribosyltransferase-isomerase QueA [candidate division WOR-3 bacterium]
MLVSEFDYYLPKELIAQEPVKNRDESRLLMLNRKTGEIHETIFKQIIDYLQPNDLLVLNETKVIPARIYGKLNKTGGKVELLLLQEIADNVWEALSRPARKLKPGTVVNFLDAQARILERKESGIRVVEFIGKDVKDLLNEQGEIALPPYIQKKPTDISRYQTVYAQKNGAVAAPTAGLHFTNELLERIRNKGIEIQKIILHCSLGTFRPVKEALVEKHKMHSEEFEITPETAEAINSAKRAERRIVAVGTTVVRALETQATFKINNTWQITPKTGVTDLYIYPGYEFKIIDAMITNFHLPKSTLLMLVCAFAKKEYIFNAYQYAIKNRFRFYSFGDAMFIY